METIAVLFVFFVLLALALIFYVAYSNSSSEQKLKESKQLLATELAQKVSNLKEIQASSQGVSKVNSIDLFKVQALSNLIGRDDKIKLIYGTDFGSSEIMLKEIYPQQRNWTIYSNLPSVSDTDANKDAGLVIPFFIPISIFEPPNKEHPIGRNSYGILEVWYYG